MNQTHAPACTLCCGPHGASNRILAETALWIIETAARFSLFRGQILTFQSVFAPEYPPEFVPCVATA
jgi:hypothetical protein